MKFPFLAKLWAAVFGAGNSEVTIDEKTGAVTMSKEQFEATEKMAGDLDAANTKISTLETKITELTTAKDAAVTAGNNALNAFKTELGLEASADEAAVKNRIAELKAMPAAPGANSKNTTETPVAEVSAEVQAKLDNMSHNKAASEFLGN